MEPVSSLKSNSSLSESVCLSYGLISTIQECLPSNYRMFGVVIKKESVGAKFRLDFYLKTSSVYF